MSPRVIPEPGLSTGEVAVLAAVEFVACSLALALGLAIARRVWPEVKP